MNAIDSDQMSSNKSPGSDGLTVEFYKTCWDKIKQTTYYLNSINNCFQTGHLTQLQQQRIFIPIPKCGNNLDSLTT